MSNIVYLEYIEYVQILSMQSGWNEKTNKSTPLLLKKWRIFVRVQNYAVFNDGKFSDHFGFLKSFMKWDN